MSNPFADPLFWPVVARVVALLGAGLVIVAAVERRPWSELRQTVLFRRVQSWAVMAPTFVIAVFAGGLIGLAVIGFLVVQGSLEYARLVRIDDRYRRLLLVAGVATLALTGYLTRFFLFAPLAFFVLVTLVPVVSGEVRNAFSQISGTLFGYIYVPFLLAYFVFIRELEPDGLAILLLVGFSVALADVLAYVAGRLLDGPKLAPRVSPNKTWGGVAGAAVGAYAGLALMWFAIPGEWSTLTRFLAPGVLAAAAVWGDLIESVVKRDFQVKDAGAIIPGFGGVLDRIDSLLVGLPVTYYAIIIAQHFSVGPRG